MNRNKHLLLWSSLGVLLLLIAAAVQENFLKDWRQIQVATRTATGPADVRLRQVVSPKLNVTDRCVSCHVGMAPGEEPAVEGPRLATTPHPYVVHDPGEFGCTVCHGGQGRATEMADAHGDVHHWPQPMIPIEYAEAGCGTCHTHIRVSSGARLDWGERLIARYDCFACHRIDGRGGTLRPGGAGGMEGPDLSAIGAAGYDRDWYAKHLKQHELALKELGQAARDEADHPGFDDVWKNAFGPIDESHRQVVDDYLASRVGAPRLVEAKALFHSLGCRGCHKIGGVGGDDGPDLTRTGDKDPLFLDFSHVSGPHTIANWHAEHLRRPSVVVPGSQMPDFGLTDPQIDLLTLYLMSLRRSGDHEAYWPKDRILAERFGEREFGTDGGTLFGTFCAACHGDSGQGLRYPGSPPFPAVGNSDFLAAASDRFLAETIRQGRPGRRMPAWGETQGGLRDAEIDEIVRHLREQAGVPEPQPERTERRWVAADPEAGRRLYENHCVSCHGMPAKKPGQAPGDPLQAEGLLAPQLSNPALLAAADDSYLFETIARGRRGTSMPGFRSGSPIHPALSDAQIEALVAFLRTWEKDK
jgi:cbb3-type cytochrome c oxidase subunit III